MPNNTMMMIHNPWTYASGNSDELREQADLLDKIGSSLFITYQSRTGMGEETLKAMLASDTWLTADECLANGFCDQVVDPIITAKAGFDVSKFPAQAQAVYTQAQANIEPETDADIDEVLGDGTEPEQAPETPLTDIDDDDAMEALAKQVESDILVYAKTVVELCVLAGMPHKSVEFIKGYTSLETVRVQLLAAKANAQQPINTSQTTDLKWSAMTLTQKSTLIRFDPVEASRLQQLEH